MLFIQRARLSFPDLFEAKAFQNTGEPTYSATFYLENSDPQISQIKSAIAAKATEKWPKNVASVLAQIDGDKNKNCFIPGIKRHESFADGWVLSAKRQLKDGRPQVVDANGAPLTAEDGKIYSGCYVNAYVEIWAQDNQFGKGLRATLVGVQFAGNGPAFSSVPRADSVVFAPISLGADADGLAGLV